MNRFIGFAYSLIIRLAGIVLLPAVIYKALTRNKEYYEHLGRYPRAETGNEKKSIWFHCSSVGESRIAALVIDEIRKNNPDLRIVLTIVTPTGKKIARELLGNSVEVYFFPLDINFILKKAFKFIKPEKIIIIETEIYPNLLRMAIANSIGLYLINGRISDQSFNKYHALRNWLGPILSKFKALMMQSDTDLERIIALGADPELCRVLPNIKYGLIRRQLDQIDRQKTFAMLNLNGNDWIIVAGSTRAGEEHPIVRAFKLLKQKYIDLKLVIAPRHLDRLESIKIYVQEAYLSYVLRTDITGDQQLSECDVIILNTMGELTSVYSIAKAAFVGGSLASKGGQNPLEPIGLGVPTCYGPHMENFAQIEKTVSSLKLSVQVSNEIDLYNFFDNVLSEKISLPDPSRLFEIYGRSAETTAEIIMKK